MGLYRRLNELEDARGVEGFAAELIDRFGKLPPATQNLLKLIEIKMNCVSACIAKMDLGPRGALVSSTTTISRTSRGLIAYVDWLQGTAKLRPDSKPRHHPRMGHAEARLNGALQLSRGWRKSRLRRARPGPASPAYRYQQPESAGSLIIIAARARECEELPFCFHASAMTFRSIDFAMSMMRARWPLIAADPEISQPRPLSIFQIIDGQPLEVSKAGIAGAEIVDGDASPALEGARAVRRRPPYPRSGRFR